MKIGLFLPCYVDQVAPSVGIATVKLLRRLGHDVLFPESQTCCGQPAFNTGYWDEAAELGMQQIDTFLSAGAEAIVCPSGSCTAMQKVFYPTLFQDKPQEQAARALADITFDLPEFLVRKLGVVDVGAHFNGKAVLHKSCHSLRELGCRTEARQLLDHVKGLEMLPLADDEECCGFGGTFAIKVPDVSTAMGEVKVDNVLATKADWVISGDSSCLFHLQGILSRRKLRPKTIHIAEVLASTE
jgi:L-lactate dehydrogenase complex protein LldE